jgi:hypothetical protein
MRSEDDSVQNSQRLSTDNTLNMGYKILAWIIVNRLSPQLQTVLQTSQYSGARDCTILDSAAGIRDVLPFADITKQVECLLYLDFSAAFDNISRECLFYVLRQNRLDEVSLTLIQAF